MSVKKSIIPALLVCLVIILSMGLYRNIKLREIRHNLDKICDRITEEKINSYKKIKSELVAKNNDNYVFNLFECIPNRNPIIPYPVIFKCNDENKYKNLNSKIKYISLRSNLKSFIFGKTYFSEPTQSNDRYIISVSTPLAYSGTSIVKMVNIIFDISDYMSKINTVKTIGLTSIFVILASYFVVIGFFLLNQKFAVQRSIALDENIIESYDDREMFKRRRAKRLKADILLLEYKCGGIFGFFRTWQKTPINDISNTGAGIFSKVELKKGKTIAIRMKIPGTGNEFITKAGIMYSRKLPKKNYFRVGIKFFGRTFSCKTLERLIAS